MILKGQGTPRDTERGLSFLRQSAAQGDGGAMLMLARTLYLGRYGVEPDPREARRWEDAAAKKNRKLRWRGPPPPGSRQADPPGN